MKCDKFSLCCYKASIPINVRGNVWWIALQMQTASFLRTGAVLTVLVGTKDLSLPHFFALSSTLFVLVGFSFPLCFFSSSFISCWPACLLLRPPATPARRRGTEDTLSRVFNDAGSFRGHNGRGVCKGIWWGCFNAFHVFYVARLPLSFVHVKCWGFNFFLLSLRVRFFRDVWYYRQDDENHGVFHLSRYF